MKNYSAIVCASVLAIALSACGGGEEAPPDPSPQPEESGTVDGSDVVASGGADASPATQTPFGTAVLVTSPTKVRSLPSLTSSTSVADRINSTSSGKADPFAGRVISVRAVPPEPSEVEASFPLAGRRTSPASDLGDALVDGDTNGAGRVSSTNRPVSGTTPASSDDSASDDSGAADNSGSLPDLAARPPIPDPALARGVEVTGIVLVGANYQAIVKAPNEPTSRYVTAGQRLSGGRVLVKRIENQGSEPVVILEEDGVEVVRSIGAPAEGSAGDATAMLPELLPAS